MTPARRPSPPAIITPDRAADVALDITKPTGPAPASPRIRSATLFAGGDELVILHRGREYRLRITRNDRLILNA